MKKILRVCRALFVALIMLILCGTVLPARVLPARLFALHAQEVKQKSGIELYPAALDITIDAAKPEETASIFIINNNQEPIELELNSIDFRQKDLSGIVQFLGVQSETYSYSLASYIQLPFTDIKLDPGEKKEVPIMIINRQDLSPGGHYAGIIVRQKPIKAQRKTVILPSVASLLFLRKTGGEQFNLSIRDVDWPKDIVQFSYPGKLTLTFQNEGNVHLIPRGRIEIRDIFGRLISKGIINVSSVYVFPSSRRHIPIEINKLRPSLPFSINTVTIKGNDSLKKTNFLFQESYVYINPVFVFTSLLSAILIIFLRRNSPRRFAVSSPKK